MSIQEENTRQLSRLVKQQEETISKLKGLVEESYEEAWWSGYCVGDESRGHTVSCGDEWDTSNTKSELEKL